FGGGRYLKFVAEAAYDFGARAAQQAGEAVFGQAVGNRRDRRENRRGIGTERDGNGERLARMPLHVVAKVERATAMRQPSHDRAPGIENLLTIDAEVLARALRPTRYHQAPGDELSRILGPARLHRNAREID